MRKQTDYNVPVSDDNNEIKFLNYSFEDGDFKGLTGSVFVPITKAELKERTSKSNVIEQLRDCFDNKTIKELCEMYSQMKANDEITSFMFDLSYQDSVWDKLRGLGYNEKKYPIFECVGGGRCFSIGEKFNLRPDLEHLLTEFES